jgi:hypothetical protein
LAEDYGLRLRLYVLERYVAMALSSRGVIWDPINGLTPKGKIADDEVLMQMFGYSPWDPKKLDKGG